MGVNLPRVSAIDGIGALIAAVGGGVRRYIKLKNLPNDEFVRMSTKKKVGLVARDSAIGAVLGGGLTYGGRQGFNGLQKIFRNAERRTNADFIKTMGGRNVTDIQEVGKGKFQVTVTQKIGNKGERESIGSFSWDNLPSILRSKRLKGENVLGTVVHVNK